jgi:Carbohydrate binding module (family 6)/Bacterial Ig domain/PA14 domain
MTAVVVHTPQGQVTLPDASALVEVVDGVTRVQVGRGKPQIARFDGKAAVEGVTGGVVVVRAGSDPAVDGGGVFVRGIKFGDGVVTIDRNQWLSLAEALGGGLTIDAGARIGQPVQISGVGMDFDTKRMLDTGLIGEAGRVSLRQTLPNGDYDLSLWVAGVADVQLEQVTLAIAGAQVPLGPTTSKSDRWRLIGPCRVQVRNRTLDLALAGLGNAHLAGLELDAAGPLAGTLPPLILLTDPAPGATIPPLDVAVRTRVDAAGGIAKVTFFNGEVQLGEATTPPYTFVWRTPPVGPYTLNAVVTDNAGVTSRSAAVSGIVQDLAQSRGLMREVWRRIGGGSINDLRGSLASQAPEIDLVPNTDYRLVGSDFGARFRAALLPPSDGDYIFEVISDDSSEVWLSTDEDPANRRLLCFIAGYVDAGQWSRVPSQRSQPVALKGGQRCFLEVLYKQGGGSAHLQLGWIRPDGATERPIPADRFVPLVMSGVVPSARAITPDTPKPTTTTTAATPTGTAPPVIPRVVPAAPAGPTVTGSVAPSLQVANLSDLGVTDWIHYGIVDAASVTRRRGGPEQLSVAKTADGAGINRYDNNHTRFGWNDGGSVPVVAATNTGWFTGNRGKGFTFTAPADPGLRRLMVWVGGHDTHGIFTATLSDGSAPAYRDDSINIGDTNGWFCYTLLYRAKTVGAKLTISYSSDKANDGNITLQAAALTEYADAKPRFVKGINLGGDGFTIDGNAWISQKDAETAGLVIYNSRRISGTGEPVPAAEAGMKPMLRTGVAAKGGDLEIHDRAIPNGRYEVTLYLCETGAANSHLFDVTVNDASLNDIGQLPKNGWAAYGPLTVTVTKGVLSIMTKGKKGAAQLMGIAVHTAGDDRGAWTNAFPGGRAHPLPGQILFADFDVGVNGVAFQEREDKPRNPFYRTEPVGINQYHGSPVVAYVPEGEWLRYTVSVKEPGTYTVSVKYAKANGADPKNARVQFEVDGNAVGGELRLEDTQRWDNAKTVTSTPFTLTAGIHDLRALFHGEQDEIGDLWSMEFKRTGP